jgi:hypothetical protein
MTASVVGSGDRVSGGASNSPCLYLKVLLLYLYLVAVPGWPSFGPGPEGAQAQLGPPSRLTRDGGPYWSGSTA